MKPERSERPFVTANFALTWDARISTRRGTPTDFSSPRDKRRLLEIRARCDAVLVSARTVTIENMMMGLPDEALRAARVRRKQAPYPTRVLLSNSGRIDPKLRIFEKAFSPVVIFSTTRMPAATRTALAPRADLWLHESERVNLAAMLATLRHDYGIDRLVCEGGGRVLRSLVAADLVDEIHVTLCPRIFGGIETPTLTGIAAEFLPKSVPLTLQKMEIIEGECFLRYAIVRR
ncbi:MAG TPA: dihydrofolate reductase family protein [Chthoniobacteraceae bacterium]|nr:dihydrofolate reductase family protein [Chthoniobacteraceae bacterium]